MKVIDLLNKIANNEEVPKKIKFGMAIYELTEKLRYEDIEDKKIFEQRFIFESLNDEIEIIEEKPKKIEKLNLLYKQYELVDKINELTKAVNYLLEKESDK